MTAAATIAKMNDAEEKIDESNKRSGPNNNDGDDGIAKKSDRKMKKKKKQISKKDRSDNAEKLKTIRSRVKKDDGKEDTPCDGDSTEKSPNKKKKKRKRNDENNNDNNDEEDSKSSREEGREDEKYAKSKENEEPKKSKKKKKKKKATDKKQVKVEDDKKHQTASSLSKKEQRDEKRMKRAQRRLERSKLLTQIPKVDHETGVPFTKIQIRRMVRRVKKGLHPIPTKEEEEERIKRERMERKLEEEEWRDVLYDRVTEEETGTNVEAGNDDEDEEKDQQQEEGVDDDDDDENGEANNKAQMIQDDERKVMHQQSEQTQEQTINNEPRKKQRRNKHVPLDYICAACNNSHMPSHWIYDCPSKIRKYSQNTATFHAGIHAPDARKVFVSGLPFETKRGDVEKYFRDRNCGAVVKCKLLTFDDTGRCKGQAYVTFDTEDNAKKALKLNGTILEINHEDDEDGQEGEAKSRKNNISAGEKKKKKKELRLKISKVLSRYEMKRKRGSF